MSKAVTEWQGGEEFLKVNNKLEDIYALHVDSQLLKQGHRDIDLQSLYFNFNSETEKYQSSIVVTAFLGWNKF